MSLPIDLHQEEHQSVKLSASIKLCKISNNVMLHSRVISNKDSVIPSREKVRCGPIQIITLQPYQICKICKLCVSSWNVGAMHGKVSEVLETIGCRHIDIFCAQESHWIGCSDRLISAKDFKNKFIWSRDNSGFGDVGELLNENWIDKVIPAVRLNQ